MKRYSLPILLVILSAVSFAQTNMEHLNCFPDTFNTLSYSHNENTIVLGRKSDCMMWKRNGKGDEYKISYLKGNHAVILPHGKGLCTFIYNKERDSSVLLWYKQGAAVAGTFQYKGQVNSIAPTTDGTGLYVAVEYDVFKNYLEKIDLNSGVRYVIDKLPLALNVVVFENDFIGLGGPQTIIYKPNERTYRSATLPHLGYIKSTYKSDTFKVLSEISDGAYINLYDSKMKFLNSIEHRWDENEIDTTIGTRRCPECNYSTLSSFVDFDISRDGKIIVAKDQFNKVFLTDNDGRQLHVFENSENWWFLHFIDKDTFRYFDVEKMEIVNRNIHEYK